MTRLVIMLSFLSILPLGVGCAGPSLRDCRTSQDIEACNKIYYEEIEYRHTIDKENYILCAEAYSNTQGAFMVHYDHQHGPRDRVDPYEVRRDLSTNFCHSALGEYWADY